MKFIVIILLLIATYHVNAQSPGSDVDPRFNNLEKEGVNLSQKLEYTYFFYSDDINALKDFHKTRLKKDYDLVKINFKQGEGFLMEVKKKEKHSRSSLKTRISMLAEQAEKAKKIKFHSWNVCRKDGKSLYKD